MMRTNKHAHQSLLAALESMVKVGDHKRTFSSWMTSQGCRYNSSLRLLQA